MLLLDVKNLDIFLDPDPLCQEFELTATMEEEYEITLTENMVVTGLPSNYGFISWNGSVLTVS